MIPVRLNNEVLEVKKNSSLSELLLKEGYTKRCFAVALNRQFIPAEQHSSTILQENDWIEIIVPMQGG